MARTTAFTVTLELEAGNASLMTLGKMLGATGVKPFEVKRRYDELTARHRGEIIPAVITVYTDRSFTFEIKSSPTAVLIKEAAKIETGSGVPNKNKVGKLTRSQLEAIAKEKMADLSAGSMQAAMRTIEGQCRQMGITVEG